MLREMHQRFGVHEAVHRLGPELLKRFVEFRLDFVEEELKEARAAVTAESLVDALIDISVVALGTLDAMGVHVDSAWERVMTANLNKQVGVNASRRNELGLPDLVKPAGWLPPCHRGNVGLTAKVLPTEMP